MVSSIVLLLNKMRHDMVFISFEKFVRNSLYLDSHHLQGVCNLPHKFQLYLILSITKQLQYFTHRNRNDAKQVQLI